MPRLYSTTKRLLVGAPLPSTAASHERLSKKVGLAIFSSDAVASSAFATQEILHVLVPVAGMAAIGYLTPLSLLVVVLLAIVVFSYRQTIKSYPNGGGSYIVSKDNLGTGPGLVAGASLLVDYTLTVAVSIAAGTAAVTSAIDPLRNHEVAVAVTLLVLLAIANLRGVRESGRLFAPPTYGYIAVMVVFIGYGLLRTTLGDLGELPVDQQALSHATDNGATLGTLSLFLLMRAFSSGAIALSGVEAISNGVPAFRPPSARNAAITLSWTGGILAVLFCGVAALALQLRPTLSEEETILSVMGRSVFGDHNPLYYVLQFFTAAILILSANTAFADFPRLSAVIASDGYMPRQLATRGDRLAFSNGIIVLTLASIGLLVAFDAQVSALVPLFAVGLFTSFTLSQAGMVLHHRRVREPHWQLGLAINALGAVATGIVLVVVLVSKFTEGAWVPTIMIPLIVGAFVAVHRHYRRVGQSIALREGDLDETVRHTVVVLVSHPTRVVAHAVRYAQAMRPDHLFAVTVLQDDRRRDDAEQEWAAAGFDVPLEVLDDPYRDVTSVIEAFLDDADARWADDTLTVVIPEYVVTHWWEQLLHNQSALALKARLLYRPNTVVTSVPFQVD
ncbi:MAG TPA: APC family permease [Acidimicrobiales bacterium]|nr:APC family permease [Acidimicrobiales bacterium]